MVQKWRYIHMISDPHEVISVNNNNKYQGMKLRECLNELGERGWECIAQSATATHGGYGPDTLYFLFKKPFDDSGE